MILSRKPQGANVYDDGFLKVDFELGTVRQGAEECLLTPTEYRILKKLLENKGKLLTYSVLLDSLWDEGVQLTDKHTLAVNINRLRKKNRDGRTFLYFKCIWDGVSMEMTGILCLVLAAAAAFAGWKYVQVKKDIYEYTGKLEAAISRMLKNEELEEVPGERDDLWGKMYERLARLSPLVCQQKPGDPGRKEYAERAGV